ncbi:hypothetical protein [Leadbettera azotonutricia]|uniref:Uncharacterized protein n=1 Tax=Leadbettera azotonutricia (strain ATCC BAA-888 / DSM 13862 / ZAS-9) TaxID=545695 RepID=F5Y8V6_LEAAZ|nr:hypothetical protein [Leadbettera azotonutricia]AEF80553.1 hypothetical protein TREAZ_0928 [Leadbettera azotonutricia ZAS-9]
MYRRFILLCICFLPFSLLHAQENPAPLQEDEISAFPLALILETSKTGASGSFWRPNWPPELSPDAFRAQGASMSGISFTLGDVQYKARWNDEGFVTDFPCFLEDGLVQVSIKYNAPRIKEITLAFQNGDSAKEPAELEVMEYDGDAPSLVRVNQGGLYSFVLMRWGVSLISEAWFDQDGNALAGYEYQVSTEPFSRIRSYERMSDQGSEETIIDYDSRSLVTGISGAGGNFSVHYFHGDLPRYWELEPAGSAASHYSLQWDESGFLVRLSGAVDGEGEVVDSRYEYDFDSQGNWIARREIKMVRRFGLLSPVRGSVTSRILEYKDGE